MFVSRKNGVGGWVPKSGNKLKIVTARCYNGCAWALNCNETNQASWERECWFKHATTFLSKQLEGFY